MRELLKAKDLHDKIVLLDKDIILLEKNLDSLIEHESDGTIKLSFDTEKKSKLKLDEDGSIIKDDENNNIFRGITFYVDYRDSNKDEDKSKYNKDIKLDLYSDELIITMASLLNYKQEKRKNLIKEFNSLSLKLKI